MVCLIPSGDHKNNVKVAPDVEKSNDKYLQRHQRNNIFLSESIDMNNHTDLVITKFLRFLLTY